MKPWLVTIIVLVLLCTCIESLKTKHGKSKTKHNRSRNETSEKGIKVGSNRKSKGPPIGLFNLKLPKKPKHVNKNRTSKQSKKKSSHYVSKLLRELRKCMSNATRKGTCKYGKKNDKKAMIWPKKMLPSLERMLLNKINGDDNLEGENNGDNGYENYDSPSDNSYGNSFSPTTATLGKNDFSDNWDSINPRHHHKSKFHGMDVVPLLKMLKEKVGDSSPYDSNAFTGMPSNQGNKFLTKLLLNQALGKPDRGSVMKDMMQEFFLANGNERSGEEAREAFNELIGHNNLIGANSQMEAENTNVNVGPTQGMSGISASMGSRQGMPLRVQSFGPQVLQAQELPNGQIAPLNQQGMEQRMRTNRPDMQEMMPQVANPTTRMLNNENVLNVPNLPYVPGEPNLPPGNIVMPNQLAARMPVVRNAEARPVLFAKSNNLIFEEEGENAARGIRPPPFANSHGSYEAERVMKLGPNYQSSAIPESQRPLLSAVPEKVAMEMRDGEENIVGMQGERFGDEVAAFIPELSQQELAARRDDLPSSHKIATTKAPMRSKDSPKPHNNSTRH